MKRNFQEINKVMRHKDGRYVAQKINTDRYQSTWECGTWNEAYNAGLKAFGKDNFKVIKL